MIEALHTAIAIGSFGMKAYDWVSAIRTGRSDSAALENEILRLRNQVRTEIRQLTPRISYAPNLVVCRDTTVDRQRLLSKSDQAKEILGPIQRGVQSDVLSSRLVKVPQKMSVALGANPFEVLINPRPLSVYKHTSDPELMPIFFDHDGQPFIGWQKIGTLPTLFNLQIDRSSQFLAAAARPSVPANLRPTFEELRNVLVQFTDRKTFYLEPNLPSREVEMARSKNLVDPSWRSLALIWQGSDDHWFLSDRAIHAGGGGRVTYQGLPSARIEKRALGGISFAWPKGKVREVELQFVGRLFHKHDMVNKDIFRMLDVLSTLVVRTRR